MSQTMQKEKNRIGAKLVDAVSAVFLPVVGLMSACGLLHGVLSLLLHFSLLAETDGAYQIFYAIADAPFYFLPVLVGMTAAKKIGANPVTAMVIGAVTLYPTLTAQFDAGQSLSFFSLPVPAVIYHGGVIPVLLAVTLLHFLEKLFDKILPEVVRGIFTPLLSLVLAALAVLLCFGPVGGLIGQWLADGYRLAYGASPIVAGFLLGGCLQVLVMFGFHWPILLMAMNNVATLGYDTVTVLMAPSVFAQAGAALAVLFKTKSRTDKGLCASSALSSLFGVTESAMFGVNLPRRLPMLYVLIGGAVGGAVAGFSGARASAFALPSAVSLPVFLGDGFGTFVLACAAGLVIPFLLTLFFYREPQAPVSDGE